MSVIPCKVQNFFQNKSDHIFALFDSLNAVNMAAMQTSDVQATLASYSVHNMWSRDVNLSLMSVTITVTPWSRVLLEKLTSLCSQSRNSPHFYGTRKFSTILTSAGHLSLS
jgi:hypothetical protein